MKASAVYGVKTRPVPPSGRRSEALPPAPRRAWADSGEAFAPQSLDAPSMILERRAQVDKPRELDLRAMMSSMYRSDDTPWEPPKDHINYSHYRALMKKRLRQYNGGQGGGGEGTLPPIAGAFQ